MNTNTRTWFIGGIIVIIIALFALLYMHPQSSSTGTATTTPTGNTQSVATVTYSCSAGKSITAVYYAGSASPDQPPIPGGRVELTLSDGRTMTLPQTISADGARYANASETTIFWSVGNGLTFTENGVQTYAGCIEVVNDPGGLPLSYENGTKGFSIRYPYGYTVNSNYAYQELGPGKDISGVKFTISTSTAAGTNLSADSYISVEQIPGTSAAQCSASLFLDQGSAVKARNVTETNSDIIYSVASSTGAGAGNRYEETVYAIPGTNPCIAVRYYIHYGVLENYPTGTVSQFNEQALLSQFDAIRHTLTIGH